MKPEGKSNHHAFKQKERMVAPRSIQKQRNYKKLHHQLKESFHQEKGKKKLLMEDPRTLSRVSAFKARLHGSSEQMNSQGSDDDSDGVRYPVDEEDDEKKEKISITLAEKTASLIIVVSHPISFVINGTAAIRVISGGIDILGYEVDASKKFVPVYSVPEICHLCVTTTRFETKDGIHIKHLEEVLVDVAGADKAEAILSSCTMSSVVIIAKKNLLAPAVYFAHSYLPCALPVKNILNCKVLKSFGFTICTSTKDEPGIKMSIVHEHISEIINQSILSYVENGGRTPRILIYGKKGFGKSTSLRYFINRILSTSVKRVLFLDTDPGQPEFTIPGCISLTAVDKPLLGPSYSHQKEPLMCKFHGFVNLEASLIHSQQLTEIIEYYLVHCESEILFINTAGWIKSLGLSVLTAIRVSLMPTIEVQLTDESADDEFDEFGSMDDFNIESLRGNSLTLKIPNCTSAGKTIIPAIQRGISVLTYFGQLQPFFQPLMTLNQFRPYCIPMNDYAIHIPEEDIMDQHKITAINASIVALCEVDSSKILICIDGSLPCRIMDTKNGSEHGNCIGFGFVRAVDVFKKLLYIITPVPRMKLRSVNALIKGNVQMPDIVFTKQKPTQPLALPYITKMLTSKNILGDKVKRRTFREKQKC